MSVTLSIATPNFPRNGAVIQETTSSSEIYVHYRGMELLQESGIDYVEIPAFQREADDRKEWLEMASLAIKNTDGLFIATGYRHHLRLDTSNVIEIAVAEKADKPVFVQSPLDKLGIKIVPDHPKIYEVNGRTNIIKEILGE